MQNKQEKSGYFAHVYNGIRLDFDCISFANVFIKIIESFRLSELYTPEALIHEYRESMQEELNDYSLLLGNVFRTAEMQFETARFSGLKESELQEYKRLSEQIKEVYTLMRHKTIRFARLIVIQEK